MSKVTNNQIQQFRDTGTLFLRSGEPKTRLNFAVDKMVKKLKALHEKYVDDQADLRADHAAIDPDTKVILKGEDGHFQYTPENEKKLRKELRDLGNKLIEIEPHLVKEEELPKSLSFKFEIDGKSYSKSDYDVRNEFEGFVIAPQTEE